MVSITGSITFHVRAKPADFYPRKRKKMPGFSNMTSDSALLNPTEEQQLPFLVETNPDGSPISRGNVFKFIIPSTVVEVGTDPALPVSYTHLTLPTIA